MRQQVRTICGAAMLSLASPALAQSPPSPPAPASMDRKSLEEEMTRLRALVSNGAVTAQRPVGCTSSDHRAFDFWLGEWDVSGSGTSALVAESSITLHDQGCAILEHWRPFQGASGHSINGYDSGAKQWTQTWIDATGRVTHYAGSFTVGTMALDVTNGKPGAPKTRMNFRALDANSVRQWGEIWDDKGKKWSVSWDLTYRRRVGTRP